MGWCLANHLGFRVENKEKPILNSGKTPMLHAMPLSMCLIVPIGPIMSLLRAWFGSARQKLKNAKVDLPYPLQEPQLFTFKDAERLPLPENKAVKEAKDKIAEGDFQSAKLILIEQWFACSSRDNPEIPRLLLRAAIANLYEAQGDIPRARMIAQMPLLILDSALDRAKLHPEEPIGDEIADHQ